MKTKDEKWMEDNGLGRSSILHCVCRTYFIKFSINKMAYIQILDIILSGRYTSYWYIVKM